MNSAAVPDPGDPIAWSTAPRDYLSVAETWRDEWAYRAHELRNLADTELRAVARLALRQGFVLRTDQWQLAGVTSARQRSLIRRRTWYSPGRSISAVVHPKNNDRAHAALAATAAALRPPAGVISHESAGVLHGLPVRSLPAAAVLTIRPTATSGSGPHPRLALHRVQLRPGEVVFWYGSAVTSVARTVMDVARSDRAAGLMAADAALREGLVQIGGLVAASKQCDGWPGSTSARWVAANADPGAESPLESLVRWCVLMAGLPRPELQVVLRDGRGWSARVDLLWREQRVILEADGQLKYRDDGSSLWAEKLRQERLERLGFRVVRVVWGDIELRPAETIARIQSALTRPR